jgi:prevent-host-death family protein
MDKVDTMAPSAAAGAAVKRTVVGAAQLEDRLAELLRHVEHTGERIVVTRRGRPVAAMVAVADAHFLERFEQLAHPSEVLGRLKKLDFEEPIEPRELRLRLKRLLCDLGRPGDRVANVSARSPRPRRSRAMIPPKE